MVEHPSLKQARELLEHVGDPAMRALIRYWMAIHPGPVLPGRRDFDPIEVPAALKNVVLSDVERDPYRFKVRLMGTAVVAAFGKDFTGMYFDEAIPDFERTYGFVHRVEVVETRLPNYRYGPPSMNFNLDFAPVERIHLPLAADGTRVDMILSMTMYLAVGGAG